MNQDFRPLLVVPAIPHGTGIRFLHPKTQYDVDQYPDVIWAILALCDGHNSVRTIAACVFKQYPHATMKTITDIISDLAKLGVLADSPEANPSEVDSADALSNLWRRLVGRTKAVRVAKITAVNRSLPGDPLIAAAAVFAPVPGGDDQRPYQERTTGGTATTAAQALIKAIAEAYERYAGGLVRVDVTAKAAELTEPWLDPRRIAPLTGQQYKKLPHLQPFSEHKTWQWVRGFDVLSGAALFAPIDLVFYPVVAENFGRRLCVDASSSGVAAFTGEPGAVKRGLLELIERDAIMRSWFRRSSPPRVATAQLPENWRRRHEYWQAQGRDTYVLDLSDHGVVTVLIAIVSQSQYPCFSAGAASSIESFDEAVAKAFHEAESGLLDALGQPKTRKIRPEDVADTLDHAKLYNHPDHLGHIGWLWSSQENAPAPRPSATYEQLINKFKPAAVRLSPPGSPLSVVRVISDRLVPINFGYGTEHFSHTAIHSGLNPDSLMLPHYFS